MNERLVFCSPPMAHFPLLDRLPAVREAGFSAISIQPGDVWALEQEGMPAPEIAARIAGEGLGIAEMDCTGNWMARHEAQQSGDAMARLLYSLDAETVVATAARVGASSVVAIDLSSTPPGVDEAAEGFARLCDLAAAHGLKAQIEFLPCSAIRSLAQAWEIVREAGRPNGGLTIDSWHFFRSGSTLDELSAIPGQRVHTIQLNDAPAQPQADLWAETMNARLLPGEGELDLRGLVATLDRIGCTAPVGVEVFNARQGDQTLSQVATSWAEATRALLARIRGTS